MMELGYEGIELDLDTPDSVSRAAERVLQLTNHRLDALFNNAGYGVYGPLQTLSREQLHQQFSTNLFGTHQLTMLLLPALQVHGAGRIVMTSSVMGFIATPGRGAYAASKYALEAWSDTLRMEQRSYGIRVSIIEPGPIHTQFTENVNQTERDKPIRNPGIAVRFTLGPEAVVNKVCHALESSHPRLRYPVTLVAHIMSVLRRLLPARALDKILQG